MDDSGSHHKKMWDQHSGVKLIPFCFSVLTFALLSVELPYAVGLDALRPKPSSNSDVSEPISPGPAKTRASTDGLTRSLESETNIGILSSSSAAHSTLLEHG